MKGVTYFHWWGFSINEGQLPNVHLSWWMAGFGIQFYLAITTEYRWFGAWPAPVRACPSRRSRWLVAAWSRLPCRG